MRNLVAPAEGEVGPAVDEEDGGSRWGGGVCEEVVVGLAVEEDIVVLDSGVVRCKLVGSHGAFLDGFYERKWLCEESIEGGNTYGDA